MGEKRKNKEIADEDLDQATGGGIYVPLISHDQESEYIMYCRCASPEGTGTCSSCGYPIKQ